MSKIKILNAFAGQATKNSLRFYTTPPVEYPYVMRPIHKQINFEPLHEIVDIGIYDLLKQPYIHTDEKLQRWKQLQTKGWKVVPDYPDVKKEHGVKEFDIDNIEESKKLLEKYYDHTDTTHLPVIQGYFDDWYIFDQYCTWFKDNFELPGSNAIAIGTVCKAGSKKAVTKIIKIVRSHFRDLHIHAFGLKLNHFDTVYKYIDSWDSMSWTFPRGRGNSSCSNKIERIEYFYNYLETIERITKNDYNFEKGELIYNNSVLEEFFQ